VPDARFAGVVNITELVPGSKGSIGVGVIVDPGGKPVTFTVVDPKKPVHSTSYLYVTVCPAETVCGGLTVKLRVG
jgi:hypothetical protein